MKPVRRAFTVKPSLQQGWVMIEIILCLALLSVVLYAAQRQSEYHWQSIQLAQQAQKQADNHRKQAIMKQLTGSAAWLDRDKADYPSYPNCQLCKESQLKAWFYASLYPVTEYPVADDKGRAP